MPAEAQVGKTTTNTAAAAARIMTPIHPASFPEATVGQPAEPARFMRASQLLTKETA